MKKTKKLAEIINLKGKKVLITGAGAGIGKAMAERFAEAGADLILLDIDEKGLLQTKDSLSGFSCKKEIYKIDLAKKGEIDAFWQKLGEETPDILINNAGIYPSKEFLEIDEKFLDNIFNVNLNSVFWMCQHFIKKREKKGGVIINVSSIEALLPFKDNEVSYSASKAGVLALTRALARDYGRKGFRVNVIVPGAITTPGTKERMKETIKKIDLRAIQTGYDFQRRLALGRWGEPDEVAKVTIFLASDLSSYVQGALIAVDGGFLSS